MGLNSIAFRQKQDTTDTHHNPPLRLRHCAAAAVRRLHALPYTFYSIVSRDDVLVLTTKFLTILTRAKPSTPAPEQVHRKDRRSNLSLGFDQRTTQTS